MRHLITQLLADVTTAVPTNGSAVETKNRNLTVEAIGTVSAGAGSATVLIQGSNDGSNWHTIDTLSLTIASSSSNGLDYYHGETNFKYVRGSVTAISGTDATVNAYASAFE